MYAPNVQEEAKLDAMQRVWQSRRGTTSSTAFFEEVCETEDILSLPTQALVNIQRGACVPPPQSSTCDVEKDCDFLNVQEQVVELKPVQKQRGSLKLDASVLGDLPALYTICALESHQFPVVGVYIDKRVVPGFKYKVRPLPQVGYSSTEKKCLFNNKALTLKSIGRGFARRFTFEADQNKINENENYFWSDNRPEGYAFELEVISEGDKFTIYDLAKEPQGTVEVMKIEGPQLEISSSHTKDGIEKKANVRFTGKVEFYETGVAKPILLSGVAVAIKQKGQTTAQIKKVINVSIKRQRWYLMPGIQNIHRRFTVRGEDINDVPTKYTMNGLQPYEFPVVGTYVDPRVIPGFCYKVRPNNRKQHLFGGRPLRLLSIGMGYAKRLTFEPDSLVSPDNYLWSDNHPDGLGLEPRAVQTGMTFIVKAGEQTLGEAVVFRDDMPQFEEKTEKVKTASGLYAIEKYIHIDVMCNIHLARTGGASTENESHTMRVSGLAVVRKEPKSNKANVVKVNNVGLDSQLRVLFEQTHTELIFIPKTY